MLEVKNLIHVIKLVGINIKFRSTLSVSEGLVVLNEAL